MVQLLVVDFEPPDVTDRKLITVCAGNRCEEVDALLKKPIAPDITGDFGWTALHTAAWAGNSKCMCLLLEARANHDQEDSFGSTPLYFAAERNNLEAVQLLVAAGADKDKAANDGSTALHIATSVCSKCLMFYFFPSRFPSSGKYAVVSGPCISKSKAIVNGHLSVVWLLLFHMFGEVDDENVLKDWPSNSLTSADSATGAFGTAPSQWLSV